MSSSILAVGSSTHKVVLELDDQWYRALQQIFNPDLAEDGETLRWVSHEVKEEPCQSCDADDMDEYACFNDKGYCVDCCACDEHREEDHLGSWRD